MLTSLLFVSSETLYFILGFICIYAIIALVAYLFLRYSCDELRKEDKIDFIITSAVWPVILIILFLIFSIELYETLCDKFGRKQ